MAAESTYSVLGAALVTQLNQRPALSDPHVLDFIPVKADEMRTPSGKYEVIGIGEGVGVFSDVVFTDGGLRFDEDLNLTVVIEVHGTDSADSAPVVKARVNALVYELFAELAHQVTWDKPALGLDIFDYLMVTPAAAEWNAGRLQQTGVYACGCDVTLLAESRRSFT